MTYQLFTNFVHYLFFKRVSVTCQLSQLILVILRFQNVLNLCTFADSFHQGKAFILLPLLLYLLLWLIATLKYHLFLMSVYRGRDYIDGRLPGLMHALYDHHGMQLHC